jgi:hypothetical protein
MEIEQKLKELSKKYEIPEQLLKDAIAPMRPKTPQSDRALLRIKPLCVLLCAR